MNFKVIFLACYNSDGWHTHMEIEAQMQDIDVIPP